MSALKKLKARRKAAETERQEFDPLIQEAYDYAIPYRRSANAGSTNVGGSGNAGKGEKRVNRIFDQTATVAAFRGAGRLAQDLWPAGEQNFSLTPGPLLPPNVKEQLVAPLALISAIIGAMTMDGEFDQALQEMCVDLQASTGAMLILKGDGPKFARFISVPLSDIVLEPDPYGGVGGIFYPRKFTLRGIDEAWPNASWPTDLKDELENKPESEIVVYQDTVWNPKAKRWEFTVWSNKWRDGEQPIDEQKFRTCPWLTPRYFRVPGEVYGRGPIMLAMSSIKTLNTAAKIALQAAAIAMLGIYTAVDDGVFNPDASPLAPGSFWKVQRNGGNLGPSVARFPDPNIELSNIVLADFRMGIKEAMNDQALPPDTAAVRSASEILERVKRLASDHSGAYGRMVSEIIVPLVRRLIEIAYDHKLIADAPQIDQLLVQVTVNSPLATARQANRVQKIIQAVEMALQLLGPEASDVIKIKDALVEAFRAIGVPEPLIVKVEERVAMEQQRQAEAVATAAAEAAPEIIAAAEAEEQAEAEDPAAQPTPEMMV